jgi:hypothetical protein
MLSLSLALAHVDKLGRGQALSGFGLLGHNAGRGQGKFVFTMINFKIQYDNISQIAMIICRKNHTLTSRIVRVYDISAI